MEMHHPPFTCKGEKRLTRENDPCPAKKSRNDQYSDFEASFLQENPGPSRNIARIENFRKQFVPLNSLPPFEAAFSIFEIRERILYYLSLRDLLQLRLVSQNWRRYATNETLLKENVFLIEKTVVSRRFGLETRGKGYRCDKKLIELTKLMNTTGSYQFPCSQFVITYGKYWESEGKEIQEFLVNHGSRINKLTLHLSYKETCSHFSGISPICSHEEKWLLQILRKLLLEQVPNIVEIELFRLDNYGPRKYPCKIDLAKKPMDQVPGVIASYTKLRSVLISNDIPASAFDFICRAAPNLIDLKCENLNYYLEPINRLRFLKELNYYPCSSSSRENLIIQRIASTKGQLQLSKLCIEFSTLDSYTEDLPEITDVVNNILEKCCHSLKILEMTPSGYFPRLKFPRMPKIHTISFQTFPPIDGQTVHFFPQGVRISDTFPNLNTLHILIFKVCENWYIFDDYFLLCSKKEVLTSVKEIMVNWDPTTSQNSRRWFPNAVYSNSN